MGRHDPLPPDYAQEVTDVVIDPSQQAVHVAEEMEAAGEVDGVMM